MSIQKNEKQVWTNLTIQKRKQNAALYKSKNIVDKLIDRAYNNNR